jgi:integrase
VARQGRCAVVAAGPGLVPVPRPQAEDTSHDCSRAGCQPHRCRPMSGRTIRQIHAILSGAFAAAVRWEWIDRNPAGSAKLPKAPHRSPTSPTPATVAAVIAATTDQGLHLLGMYLWLAAVTGARLGELCGLQWADVDLDAGLVHIAFSYLVRAGQKIRKDTKTHQDRTLAIDTVTVAVLAQRKQHVQTVLADAGVMLAPTAYVFTSDPAGRTPWNPDWLTHKVAEVAMSPGSAIVADSHRHDRLARRIGDLHLMTVPVGVEPDDGIDRLCQHGHAASHLLPGSGPASARPGRSHRVAHL